MLVQSITRNSLLLSVFALVTAGALALTFALTKEQIADQERKAAARALLEIIPASRHDNELLDTIWQIPQSLLDELGLDDEANIHVATQNNTPVAMIIPAVAPDGYSGDIRMLVGINIDGSLAGVRVLSHKETPGLGDKIDLNKSDWILSFDGLSLEQPAAENWKVRKDGGDFDQFTGATITPRAVVKRVYETLTVFQEHQATILASLQTETNDE